MRQTLESIRNGLRHEVYTNEASVSQGIVLNLLGELGWDTFDVGAVSPEYSVKGRRVDYALCYPRNRPKVFVEVKQVGKSTLDFEEQLSAYAYEEGVPLVVLTTGKEWNFYVPYGPGKFMDRRVYRIDLLERSVDEVIHRLNRYLAFDGVKSGEFTANAQNDLKEVLSFQEAKRTLPLAWEKLLEEPAPDLVELVMQRLETMTGDAPQPEVVKAFLRGMANTSPTDAEGNGPRRRLHRDTAPPQTRGPLRNTQQDGHLYLNVLGQETHFSTHRSRLLKVFELLHLRDNDFLNRFAAEAKPGKRPGVARNPKALYPGNELLAETRSNYAEIPSSNGWYIDVNRSASQMEIMIQKACQIANLRFGRDVTIS